MADFLEDGTFDFSQGQDAWHHPDRILENQYSKGINVTTLGGVLSPRPGFRQLQLIFEQKFIVSSYGRQRSIEEIWTTGKMQAAIPYVSYPDNYIITVVCGLLFKTNVRTRYTFLMDAPRVNQYAQRINWSHADSKIVVFDYPDYPLIIDGDTVTRADPDHMIGGDAQPQVPISVLGAYNQNRLFVANDGVEFTAGDPVGNLLTPEAPITFSEVFTPSSPFVNQFFALPVGDANYPISAMGFIQQQDESTGIGSMFSATRKKIFWHKTNQPRANWEAEKFSGVMLSNTGIAGPQAFVNVNSDLLFMSAEMDIHALSVARNDAQKWSNVPISREVNNWVKSADPELSRLASMGFSNNRIFVSVNPYRVVAQDRDGRPVSDWAHAGLVVLEIENLASFLSDGNPVWAGLWTGVNPAAMVSVGDEFVVASKDGSGAYARNALYVLEREERVDTVAGRKRRVRSVVYSKMYNFKQEFGQKKENTVALHVQDITGKFDIQVERRPTHAHEWLEYGHWHHEAPIDTPEMPEDDQLEGFSAHQFKHLFFGDPDKEGCNELTKDNYNVFRGIQLRITLRGDYWTLENIKLRATQVPSPELREDICVPIEPTLINNQFEPDWDIPDEESLCQ